MSVGREESRSTPITVSSGTGTALISRITAVTRWVRVVPPNESAEFDFSIKDGDGRLMFKRSDQVGTLSEHVDISLFIASSVLIENADTDGTYIVLFDMH